MKETAGTHVATDGLRLFVRGWRPAGETRAAVLLVHGYAEHSGRYQHVATYLTGQGYAVHAMDLRGHGRSEGRRGYIGSYRTLLEDLDGYFRTVRGEHAGQAHFVLGHSVGGALALLFAAQHQEKLSGVIASAAALSAGEAIPAYLIAAVRLLSRVAPRLPLIPLEAGTISKDPAVQAAYDADPLNYRGRVYARTGAQLLALAEAARRAIPQISIPALVLHGGADSLIDPGGTEEIYGLLGSGDKTCRIYEGLYHEVFNEPEKEEVLREVGDWLGARLRPGGGHAAEG